MAPSYQHFSAESCVDINRFSGVVWYYNIRCIVYIYSQPVGDKNLVAQKKKNIENFLFWTKFPPVGGRGVNQTSLKSVCNHPYVILFLPPPCAIRACHG